MSQPSTQEQHQEALQKGINHFLLPIATSADSAIQDVKATQMGLIQEIARLNNELDTFGEYCKIPSVLTHVKRLETSKEKLVAIEQTITIIETRLARCRDLGTRWQQSKSGKNHPKWTWSAWWSSSNSEANQTKSKKPQVETLKPESSSSSTSTETQSKQTTQEPLSNTNTSSESDAIIMQIEHGDTPILSDEGTSFQEESVSSDYVVVDEGEDSTQPDTDTNLEDSKSETPFPDEKPSTSPSTN